MSDNSRNMAFYGGKLSQYQQHRDIPPGMVSSSGQSETQAGPNWRFGGMVTYEKPIKEFFADIVVGPNSNITFRNDGKNDGTGLPSNCVGLRFIGLTTNVMISINGGGGRTVLNGDVITGSEISILQVITDATGTVTIQSIGTGD
jgi:hypothetical protein